MATTTECKLNPTEDRLIVVKCESEEKSSGGILLPDTAKEKPQIGTVIKVGPGKVNEKGEKIKQEDIKVGMKVVYAKYSGTEIKISGIEYLILKAGDVLATIE